MPKLIMMKGLPASGKSSKAKDLLEVSGNTVRVNKDLLRKMLHFDKWTGKKEAQTILAEETLAREFLRNGMNVIVDDTNMGEKHKQRWSSIAEDEGVTFSVIYCKESLQTLLARDEVRADQVGASVIKNMALQYGIIQQKKPFVVCDIDGTIANLDHRRPLVQQEPKGWKKFFDLMFKDNIRGDVYEKIVDLHEAGHKIIMVTARPENYRMMTENWLDKHEVPYFTVIMRRSDDRRDDSIVKEGMYNKYLKHYDILKVFDDRPRVIRKWRELGLEVEDCGDGVEF